MVLYLLDVKELIWRQIFFDDNFSETRVEIEE